MVKKYSTHANKTKKRERLLKKGIKKAQKLQHKEKDIKVNFPAIELLNDPQGFAEKLLADLKHSTERFEVNQARDQLPRGGQSVRCIHVLTTLLVTLPWRCLDGQPGQDDDHEPHLAVDRLPQVAAAQLLHVGAALPQAPAAEHHPDIGHRGPVLARRTTGSTACDAPFRSFRE